MTLVFPWVNAAYDEVLIEVEFTCSSYHHAIVSRLPDQCSPAEGGDIESIRFDSADPVALKEFCEAYKADSDLQDQVDAACFEADQRSYDGPEYY